MLFAARNHGSSFPVAALWPRVQGPRFPAKLVKQDAEFDLPAQAVSCKKFQPVQVLSERNRLRIPVN